MQVRTDNIWEVGLVSVDRGCRILIRTEIGFHNRKRIVALDAQGKFVILQFMILMSAPKSCLQNLASSSTSVESAPFSTDK